MVFVCSRLRTNRIIGLLIEIIGFLAWNISKGPGSERPPHIIRIIEMMSPKIRSRSGVFTENWITNALFSSGKRCIVTCRQVKGERDSLGKPSSFSALWPVSFPNGQPRVYQPGSESYDHAPVSGEIISCGPKVVDLSGRR
jgi:hypothetical protein